MKKFTLIGLSLLLVAALGVLPNASGQDKSNAAQKKQAEERRGMQKAFFKMLDANNDKKVTQYEFCTHVFKSAFKILDKNVDKTLTLDEWLKADGDQFNKQQR